MRLLRFLVLAGVLSLCVIVALIMQRQEGSGEQIGKTVDQTIEDLRKGAKDAADQVQKGFEEARASIERMGVQGRVYARLHWDKALHDASISVEVGRDGSVTLRGTVLDEKAKAKAEQLAADTVEVKKVVNTLAIQPQSAK